MYAVIRTGGKQYRVEEGMEILVERLEGEAGTKVQFEPLLVNGKKFVLGKGKVAASIVEHTRGPKLKVFKYRPKKRARRMVGHRQELTRIKIEKISAAAARKRVAKPEDIAEERPEDKPEAAVVAAEPAQD